MADQGQAWVQEHLLNEMTRLESMRAPEVFERGSNILLLNSLIWIYVQMAEERLKANIRILIAWSGCGTINGLARQTGLNGSFVGRVIAMDPSGGLGGWNYKNLYLLAGALKVDAPSLLFADFHTAIEAEAKFFALKSPPT